MTIENKKKKIVVYSHDTFGLGNISRMLAIAKSLVESDPNTSVLILSGSPMLHAFRIPPQIDYIKLPCLTRTMVGDYEAKFLDLGLGQLLRLRSNIIQSSIIDFDPDLILVDKKPFGVGDELSNALEELQRIGHRAKRVLLLRDILDSPESTIRVWQKNAYHQAIQKFYDQVLVVGAPDVFDLRKEYQFPSESHDKVRFCGYIAREAGRSSRAQLRQHYGFGDEHLVLVTPGGGEDGYQLLKCYLQGLRLQTQPVNTRTLVICGPEMIGSQRDHIQALVEGCPSVVLQTFTDDMMACMDAADLVISMGGYNTVCELLTLRKRAIVVPRVMPVQEQWIRAERMDKLGLLRAIHPETITPAVLMETVQQELAKLNVQPRQHYQINLNGLSVVCDSINQLMDASQTAMMPVANKQLSTRRVKQQQSKASYRMRGKDHECRIQTI
ncbi:putative glycosyl transferase [Crenothrix polyspora]|uniref:Putative glycosyl transferase n=1 Tax=Crenothrix polyspora TaxID=360316 RepID=A0A1R4HBL4_9GAMM|nr:glycosyltransferase [Crenothrix polyspora]SJM93654.1 putative glycosyl transferase [Crenothrix polyspora]